MEGAGRARATGTAAVNRATLSLLFSALAAPAAVAQVPDESSGPRDTGSMQVVVSLEERLLRVVLGPDTLLEAPIAVASGQTLSYGGRRWTFRMPRGRHVVRAKKVDPVWSPPDWHYAEVARDHGLRIRRLTSDGHRLRDGRRLVVRDSVVGLVTGPDTSGFEPLPVDEHVVFENTLFIPPFATRNRQLAGELGRYALDLGDGYLLHGTQDPLSIGSAVTHGCVRLGDDDLEWLYLHVPVGATVLVR
jgi:lipoprotein-anchoring transpeptidase ErfK/SrfK